MPEETVLSRRLAALGLTGVRRIRATDNRSVMVSLTTRLGVLSIHRGYAGAPDRVLRAVVRFLTPRTASEERRAAEEVILRFRPSLHAKGPPRRRRAPQRPPPGDLANLVRLEQLFGRFNRTRFGGLLTRVPIRISGRMRTQLGQLCMDPGTGLPYEITISRRHIEQHGWDEVAHTLLHEMVHLWQHRNGREVDHGPLFRVKAKEVGVLPSATRRVRANRRGRRAARTE
jgi:hypothetical protein